MSPESASEVFGGRYVSRGQIARGGMGRVLLAQDQLLHRDVALKTVLDPRQPDLLLRFVEESQLTGQLAHPNVVPVHELGREGAHPFLVMKRVEGRDLGQIVNELRQGGACAEREWPLPRLLRAFLQACQAVAHAHGRGVIHRDLKPANLMLGREDELLVLDWGLARPWQGPRAQDSQVGSTAREVVAASGEVLADGAPAGLTLAGAVVGTPAYMAPEQAAGDVPLDPRADVYALGAILYELLALRPPYVGESAASVLAKLFREPPPPPRAAARAGREVPAALESIVLRAMAREREARYPDAGALLRAVEAWLDDRPVVGHRESAVETLRRLARRHRAALAALLATLLLVLACALAAGLTVRGWARRAEAERLRAETARTEAAALAAAAEAVGTATHLGEEARRVALDLERLGAGPVPVDALVAAHAAARAELSRLAQALEPALAGPGEARAAAGELRAPLLEARGRVDRALAGVLAGRAPGRGLTPPPGEPGLAGLDLGPARATWTARALWRLGRRTEAAQALGGPVPAEPAARRAREALELVLRDERPLAAQLAAVEAALAAEPAAWLHLLRAELHARAGEDGAALADVERARALEPADPGPALLRLRHLLPVHANGLLLRAEADLVERLAPELAPLARSLQTVRHCGTSWASTWRREQDGQASGIEPQVAGRIERGELDPGTGGLVLAETALLLRQPAAAERWARAALAARGGMDREAQGLLAEALRAGGGLDEARTAAEEGLRRWPDDARLAWVRGALRLDAGQAGQALADLRAGARVGRDPWRWEALARALLQVGTSEALEEGVLAARRALSHEPVDTANLAGWDPPQAWDPRLQRTLGDLRRAQGHHGLAALHYVRALLRACALAGEGRPPDLSDALRAAEALERLGLRGEADWFLQLARGAADPAVRGEAERRLGGR